MRFFNLLPKNVRKRQRNWISNTKANTFSKNNRNINVTNISERWKDTNEAKVGKGRLERARKKETRGIHELPPEKEEKVDTENKRRELPLQAH